jgi:hypothetical protein
MPEAPGSLAIPLEVVLVGGVVGEADELRAALVRDMQVMMVVGAPHVEYIWCALRADQAEMGEKFLHLVEVRCLHARKGEIGDLDCRHGFLRNL